MAEDMGDKTELPTQRRIEEARSRGQVVKSQDLTGAVELSAGAILLVTLGAGAFRALAGIVRRVFEYEVSELSPGAVGSLLLEVALRAALIAAPILVLLAAIGVLVNIAQAGPVLTLEPLSPRLSRLNPVNGLGRIFSRRNLVKTLVSTVKLLVVLGVSWNYIRSAIPRVAGLPRLTAPLAMHEIGRMALELAAWLLALLLLIGIIDYLYQRWQHTQDLKMTKEEVKDERRAMDGDPQIKSKRLRMARQIAMHRISHAVPKADVVITNPTHFAVALRYDAATMKAPRVVAKGADDLAARIRQIAATHSVPIVERPPLARAIYAGVEVGREVPPEFYEAVAEVLAFVYRLEKQAA